MATNQVILHGRLVRDVELKYANNGTAILNNALAIQRDFKNKQTGERESDFINITAFAKTAEIIAEHFKKGDGIIITGRIQTNQYEKDGQKRTSTDVIVNSMDFPLAKSKANQANEQQSSDPFSNATVGISDGDLPF